MSELEMRIAQLEEQLAQRDHRLALAVTYDSAKLARIKELEAELDTWRKLRNPDYLLGSLMRDQPAALDRAQAARLLLTRPVQPAASAKL